MNRSTVHPRLARFPVLAASTRTLALDPILLDGLKVVFEEKVALFPAETNLLTRTHRKGRSSGRLTPERDYRV